MQISEISTSIISPPFVRITWCVWMNLGVINGWDPDGLVRHLLACHWSNYLGFTAAIGIKYCLYMPKMALSFLECSKVQLMPRSLKTLSTNSFTIAGNGRSQSLYSLWIMRLSIIVSTLSRCALMWESSCYIYYLTYQI